MKSRNIRVIYLIILCTTTFTTIWLQSVSLSPGTDSNAEFAAPFEMKRESGVVDVEATELQPERTPLNVARNRKRLGALELKEQKGDLKPCIRPSLIPDHMEPARKAQTTTDIVNTEVLGAMTQEVNRATKLANRTLSSIIAKRRNANKGIASPIDHMMAELDLAVDVGDYQLLPGGHWVPLKCRPLWKVAVVVPFRNRAQHLPIFLRHTIRRMKKQQLEFSIFVAEQNNDLLFNKAMMMNIGFVEAQEFNDFDCVIFHDVDHLALNVRNYYGCDNMPRHFETGEPKYDWTVMYDELFGGAVGVTTTQFYQINGFSNVYWGWGGEDDDFYHRVVASGFVPSRPEGPIGFFDALDHPEEGIRNINFAKFCLRSYFAERMATDGLSNLKYDQPTIELHPLYTNIAVDIRKLPWNPKWTRCGLSTMLVIVVTTAVMVISIALIARTIYRYQRERHRKRNLYLKVMSDQNGTYKPLNKGWDVKVAV
ncbi:beta-1,4-galactosyltransferase 5-like isoform X1 [Lytechinus variegatus]|uniref:beta-1,4-galactosyltransferase 5-like isoform X1 n=1 Tax=Lytechinus variegatus TaxID=7654 RepID=UPI001BB25ECD|nr:beta-1,4-galactosyltransferase 5-like isoform X1 [Lytechinus variegatus]XP_041472715.1 beta-1,4-galactosyltransferase 5-like isoform X1 [Lytechinus variegatus]